MVIKGKLILPASYTSQPQQVHAPLKSTPSAFSLFPDKKYTLNLNLIEPNKQNVCTNTNKQKHKKHNSITNKNINKQANCASPAPESQSD